MQRIVTFEWEWGEYEDAFRCLLRGTHNHGPEMAEMVARFGEMFPTSLVLPVNRGRFALKIALEVFAGLEPCRTEVIYPAYICDSVIEMIEQAGLVPRPADVGRELTIGVDDVERVVTDKTLAVIGVHAYGCPAPIKALEEYAGARQIFLIDDAANVAGVGVDGGKMLGGFGDAGVISFTNSKTLVAGGLNAGGLLLVNNPELAGAMGRAWAALPDPNYSAMDFLLFYRDNRFGRYSRLATYYYNRLLHRAFTKRPCPPSRMANIDAAIVLRQLVSLPQRLSGRIKVAESFHRHLGALPGVTFPQYRQGRYLTRVLLQLPPGSDLPTIRASLLRRGFETRRGYELDLRHGHTFPRAAQMAPRLIEVPSHSRTADGHVRTLCSSVAEILNSVPAGVVPAGSFSD
jgi:dTDP-4-amino-4,6-dideoxygalactose transaminase